MVWLVRTSVVSVAGASAVLVTDSDEHALVFQSCHNNCVTRRCCGFFKSFQAQGHLKKHLTSSYKPNQAQLLERTLAYVELSEA